MVGVQIESFAANTLEFLRREHELLTHGIPAPDMDTDMNGPHVLVVVRGYHYREDLAALRPYIREYKPVMVAVDGGADAMIEAAISPTPSSVIWTRCPMRRCAAARNSWCTPTRMAARPG